MLLYARLQRLGLLLHAVVDELLLAARTMRSAVGRSRR
jgi:hypothetical protein